MSTDDESHDRIGGIFLIATWVLLAVMTGSVLVRLPKIARVLDRIATALEAR